MPACSRRSFAKRGPQNQSAGNIAAGEQEHEISWATRRDGVSGGIYAATGQSAFAQGTTLWNFMGIPQGVNKVYDARANRFGNMPGTERQPALKGLADPSNLESQNPAIKAAAQIKQEEDLPGKDQSPKYLATVGCGCYPGVKEALMAGLDDCTERVRFQAAQSIAEAAATKCKNCSGTCCCDAEMGKKLSEVAYEKNDKCCFVEPSARARQAAAELRACCPGGPPPETVATPEPEATPIPPGETTTPQGEQTPTPATPNPQPVPPQPMTMKSSRTNPAVSKAPAKLSRETAKLIAENTKPFAGAVKENEMKAASARWQVKVQTARPPKALELSAAPPKPALVFVTGGEHKVSREPATFTVPSEAPKLLSSKPEVTALPVAKDRTLSGVVFVTDSTANSQLAVRSKKPASTSEPRCSSGVVRYTEPRKYESLAVLDSTVARNQSLQYDVRPAARPRAWPDGLPQRTPGNENHGGRYVAQHVGQCVPAGALGRPLERLAANRAGQHCPGRPSGSGSPRHAYRRQGCDRRRQLA